LTFLLVVDCCDSSSLLLPEFSSELFASSMVNWC